jgi:hypothetical protein
MCDKMFQNKKGLSLHLYHSSKGCLKKYRSFAQQISTNLHDFNLDTQQEGYKQMQAIDNLCRTNPEPNGESNDGNMEDAGLEEEASVEFPGLESDASTQTHLDGTQQLPLDDPGVSFAPLNMDQFPFSNDRRVEVDLLQLLDKTDAPLYAFNDMMSWAMDAHLSGYDFEPESMYSTTMMNKLQKWTKLGELRPVIEYVKLPDDDVELPVVVFDFPTMLMSLFNDTDLNQTANLVVNPKNPFTKYEAPNGRIGEPNSAAVYRYTWDHMCVNGEDFMVMIVIYMDKTVISNTARICAFPVTFSATIFNCKVSSYKPHGVVTCLEKRRSPPSGCRPETDRRHGDL